MHASGVLAVVVAGFVVGNGTLGAGYQTRLQERYVWNSVDVLLEAFVFAYIGLHLRFVLEDLREAHESLTQVAVASAIVLLIVLVIRPLSVFAMFGRSKLSSARGEPAQRAGPDAGGRGALGTRRRANPPGKWRSRIDRRSLSWQENVVVSWTGMRGVVTLAAAAAIPVTTVAGEPFPERATIQAIAFVVSVGTLLIQGWTLPLLIRRLHLSRFSDDHAADREEELKAERVVHDAADEVLAEFRANPPEGMDPRVLAEIRTTIARHSQDADEMPDPEAHTKRVRGVLGALPRRAGGAAGRIDRGARRRAASRTKRCARCWNGSTFRRPVCQRGWRAGFEFGSATKPPKSPAAEVAAATEVAAAAKPPPPSPPQPPPSQPPPSPPPAAAIPAAAVAAAIPAVHALRRPSSPWSKPSE